MSADFQRTLRSVSQEQHQTRIGFIILCTMLVVAAGWGVWLFMARVDLYEASGSARIEISQSGRAVDTLVAGRVAHVDATLGDVVKAGEVLVELDATGVDSQIAGAKIELDAMAKELENRRVQADLTEQLIAERQAQGDLALDQSKTHVALAESASSHADYMAAQRLELLHKGAGTNNDYLQARRDADAREDDLKTARLEVGRVRSQTALDLQEIKTRLADLKSRVAELEASIARRKADLQSLIQQREDRTIRAPADGVLVDLAEIRPGSVVQAGTRLATILPHGEFHVVAHFAPAAAIGRVSPGQTARVSLNGFPPEQYGGLTATVSDVAGEVRDGTIKVQLKLAANAHTAIPLQHGQPGAVQINIGRASPFDLIIRTAGQLIHSDPANSPIQTARNGNAS